MKKLIISIILILILVIGLCVLSGCNLNYEGDEIVITYPPKVIDVVEITERPTDNIGISAIIQNDTEITSAPSTPQIITNTEVQIIRVEVEKPVIIENTIEKTIWVTPEPEVEPEWRDCYQIIISSSMYLVNYDIYGSNGKYPSDVKLVHKLQYQRLPSSIKIRYYSGEVLYMSEFTWDRILRIDFDNNYVGK